MKEESEEMQLSDFSRVIHIGLRKGTDTDMSVVLWNLISIADHVVLIEMARDLKRLTREMRGVTPLAEAFTMLADSPRVPKVWGTWTPKQQQLDTALRFAWKIADAETREDVQAWVEQVT